MKRTLFLAATLLLLTSSLMAQPKSWGEPQLFIKSSQSLMAPVWSPDGSRIAVTGDNYVGIWVAHADGSGLEQVSDALGAGYAMHWSDAQNIVSTPYTVVDLKRMTRIEQIDVNTLAVKEIAQPSRSFKRSKAVGATSAYQVMLDEPQNATGKIAGLQEYAGKWVINPALSPDGKKIAFQIVSKGLFVCNSDGTELKSLGKGSHASWLPDSRHLMMTRIVDNGHNFTSSDIYCIDTTSGNSFNITPSSDVIPITIAVSPDGKHVAFDNDTDGAIYIINLNY